MLLAFIIWTVVGIVVGFVAAKVVDLHGDDPKLGIAAAVLGSIAGGVGCAFLGNAARSAYNPRAVVVSAVAAVAAAVVWHAVRSRFVSHDRPTVRRSY